MIGQHGSCIGQKPSDHPSHPIVHKAPSSVPRSFCSKNLRHVKLSSYSYHQPYTNRTLQHIATPQFPSISSMILMKNDPLKQVESRSQARQTFGVVVRNDLGTGPDERQQLDGLRWSFLLGISGNTNPVMLSLSIAFSRSSAELKASEIQLR